VHEDVARPVAVHREVVVGVHRAPVAARNGTEHDRRRVDVVGELRQPVAGVHIGECDPVPAYEGHASPRRYPNPVYDSTPTNSSSWLRYSTSITQNRPVPSFVVFGSLTERRIWRVRNRSPGRTGSWNTIVLSVITASGSAKIRFRSKCDCKGTPGSVRPGDHWCGRNHTEIMVGGAIGPPVTSSATTSSLKTGLPSPTDAQARHTHPR